MFAFSGWDGCPGTLGWVRGMVDLKILRRRRRWDLRREWWC
jgi:hypothetical protein